LALRHSALTSELRTETADWHLLSGWKRLALMGVMVSLPIPVFAASGLAVPLPSVVYRAAAGIAEQTQAVSVRLPGLGAVVSETKQVARRGTIRLAPEEAASAAPAPKRPVETAAGEGDRPRGITRRLNRGAGPGKVKRSSPRPSKRSPVDDAAKRGTEGAAASAVTGGREAAKTSAPGHSGSAPEHAPKRPEGPSGGSTDVTPVSPPKPKADPPKIDPPKVDPPRVGPPPPPPPPTPPPSLPPLPVTPPPAGPPPAPVPLPLKAQLEGIAGDLQDLIAASAGTQRAQRLSQVVDKVESAIRRLEKDPPDNQGAVGDIKNATQKLDSALAERVISLVERTLYVTRLNAVSTLLEGSS
jgi:hypothetical protein